ncbi:MAG: hypothetical protein MJ150_05650, partial [Clostridia bacterium]|nr:hypothetical protein [Clostridia bacterium]
PIGNTPEKIFIPHKETAAFFRSIGYAALDQAEQIIRFTGHPNMHVYNTLNAVYKNKFNKD